MSKPGRVQLAEAEHEPRMAVQRPCATPPNELLYLDCDFL